MRQTSLMIQTTLLPFQYSFICKCNKESSEPSPPTAFSKLNRKPVPRLHLCRTWDLGPGATGTQVPSLANWNSPNFRPAITHHCSYACSSPQGPQIPLESLLGDLPILRPLLLHPWHPWPHPRNLSEVVEAHELCFFLTADRDEPRLRLREARPGSRCVEIAQ